MQGQGTDGCEELRCEPLLPIHVLNPTSNEVPSGSRERDAPTVSEPTDTADHGVRMENWQDDAEFAELDQALSVAFGSKPKDAVMRAWGIDRSVEEYAEISHPTQTGLPLQYELLVGREKTAMDKLLAGNKKKDANCMELAAETFDDEAHSWPHAPVYVALAYAQSEVDRESVKANLRDYASAMSPSAGWDPAMLLAAARAATTQGWGSTVSYSLLALYYSIFRMQATNFMTDQDWRDLRVGNQTREARRMTAVDVGGQTPEEMWRHMRALGLSSAAMDELMRMTGLKQVKVQALSILRKIQSDKQLSERQRVPLTLNFSFMGNPGTGKTVVAHLFARILHEVGARSSAVIEKTTGQKLVQDGAIKADDVIQKAMNGVLFIDEAHSLDPKQNRSEGPAIVTKLLKAAEDDREKLTIILAGYQDEIEDRLYASDQGFKSRFQDVVFPDYNEDELRSMFVNLVESKDWQFDPTIPRLSHVVAARIARGRGNKGFANARTVRSMVEKGIERASLASRAPLLKVEDFIGPRPDIDTIPELGVALADLERMTGLTTEYKEDGSKKKRALGIPPKEAVHQLVQTVQGNYDKEIRGELPLQVSLNRLFLGNPGTGKTTVAHLYGRILQLLGLLSVGTVVVKQPGDFIAGHEGGTEQETLAILNNAAGKVLVIDEAYVFHQSNYGKIAIDMIVSKVMGSPGEDIAVLMLGYEESMLKMIREQNPGLKRRFQPEDAFYFADFDDQELLEILKHLLQSEQLSMDKRVRAKAIKMLSAERNKPHFGNAGAVNNLLTRAKTRMSARDQSTRTMCIDDLGLSAVAAGAGGDPFKELESMHKVEAIVQELTELQASILFEQKRGGRVEIPNYVFVGNPGTGKTRVANIMASMLSKLGVLENKTKVTTAQEIQGQYLGHSTAKAKEMIDDAQGGILLVDEAHNLSNSPYSIEAAKTLMTATLEDAHKGKTMLIFAGYKSRMDAMMQSVDPGMRRRFKGVIEFPDWSASDCVAYLKKLCQDDGLVLNEDREEHVLQALGVLHTRPGWGNASDAVDTHKYLTDALAMRIMHDPSSPPSTITCVDAQKAMEKFLKLRPDTVCGEDAHLSMHAQFVIGAQTRDPIRNDPKPRFEVVEEAEVFRKDTQPDGDGDEDAFSSLQLACVELGYDRDQESRKSLIDVLVRVQHGDPFPGDILECIQAKTGKNAAVLHEILRPQVHQLLTAIQEAYKTEEARLHELQCLEDERRFEEAEAARREFRRKQERLRTMGLCPAGFSWSRSGQGWRCNGGSHYISDAHLS